MGGRRSEKYNQMHWAGKAARKNKYICTRGECVCESFAAHNWIKIYTLRPGAIIPENRWENRVTLRDCVNVLNNKMQCIN